MRGHLAPFTIKENAQMTTQTTAPKFTLNKITVTGNVAFTPELKYTQGGKAVCKTTIYSTRRWEVSGEKFEKTTKVKVVAWGELAEDLHNNVGKGDLIEVVGQLEAPEAWLSKTEKEEDGSPKIEVLNVVTIFSGEVIYKKGGSAPAPSNQAPLGTENRDPAVELPDDMGDIPF